MDKAAFQGLTAGLTRLYTDGKYADAFQLIEQNADHFPDAAAQTTFWRMCLLSLCGRPDDVLSLFREGLDRGLWWAEGQFRDSDLDAVRELPEFKQLIVQSHQKCLEARKQIRSDRAVLLPDDITREMPLLIFLHGRNGNKESKLAYWEAARQRGWLILAPQSSQALYPGEVSGYCWDDPAQGIKDIIPHIEAIKHAYKIDHQRLIIAGFSQGSGMALYAVLRGMIAARGFIGIATWWEDANELACEEKGLRGYFVTGEKDHTLARAREIQNVLRAKNIPFAEEVHAELEHEFPKDFETSFDKAIEFIFM